MVKQLIVWVSLMFTGVLKLMPERERQMGDFDQG